MPAPARAGCRACRSGKLLFAYPPDLRVIGSRVIGTQLNSYDVNRNLTKGASLAATRILGIETSCDETAAAVVERHADGSGTILADVVLSQLEDHAAYGGVVPEIAARAHAEALDRLIAEALRRSDTKLEDVDAIAATSGPGLIGGLIVGLLTGKAIAM
ncbi:MAG: hypothetical protein EOP61_31825, partial [Sphingomonadales bacterium]